MAKRNSDLLRHGKSRKPARSTSPPDGGVEVKQPFPIVAIGASAGGLDALERFLGNLPEQTGMAVVVVQHLDPTRQGILVQLLQKSTSIPVVEVEDGMRVEPDRVYVIPRNKDMSILHGVLHVLDPIERRGMRLPIDFFFRSLADDRRERAVAVVLSGMGSDGTLGLRAIKGKEGAVFVQDPETAGFDGMPRSAIQTGMVDVVAPAEELSGKIIAFLNRPGPLIAEPEEDLQEEEKNALDKIIILLRSHVGHDFSLYKKTTVCRRIQRRMDVHQLDGIDSYVHYLRRNSSELELLSKELFIGVTSFFRDPEAWEQLRDQVLPELLMRASSRRSLRAWVPGCASGEEAYSLAIVFREAVEKLKPAGSHTLQIFATDLDYDAIERARQGSYPANVAADVSAERLDRFFVRIEEGYQVAKAIRESVIFAPQNVITDPPFAKLDILSCRNVLIYMMSELQRRLIPLFHYCLNPGGVLFLGHAETISGFNDLFETLGGNNRHFRRIEPTVERFLIEFPASYTRARDRKDSESSRGKSQAAGSQADLQTLMDQLLLRRFSPAAVLVNVNGDILYISGRTGQYLEPPAGKVNWNIFAMARQGLGEKLARAFRQAVRLKKAETVKNVVVRTDGGTQALDLLVEPLNEPEQLRDSVLVVFTAVSAPTPGLPGGKRRAKPQPGSSRVARLEGELAEAQQELQATREDMQSSQEELRAANEELQSTNEELQSTNEELTTSREELQSLNEELLTVNNELQAKLDELSQASNDMNNLMDSTQIATVFLDNELRVRSFTRQASTLTKLIPGDVGRPFTDIALDLIYPELEEDVRNVLGTLVALENEVVTHDGRWFTTRILPYRTLEDRVDGVVITFVDITSAKMLEAELRRTQADLRRRFGEQTEALDQTRQQLRDERTGGESEGRSTTTSKPDDPPKDY